MVDARCLADFPGGVAGSVARQLVGLDRLLQRRAAPPRITVLLPPPAQLPGEALAGTGALHRVHVDAPTGRHPASDFWLHARLPKLLHALAADVLYAPAFVAPLRTPTRRVVLLHDDLVWSQPESYPFRFRAYLGSAATLAARSAHRVLFPSEAARTAVCNRLGLDPAKAAVVPHGIDLPPWQPQPRERFVLCIANSEPRKGHALLLHALRGTGIPLHLVGFRDAGRLETLLAQIPAEERPPVVLHPVLPSAEVTCLLRRAGVLALPTRGEGFCLPVLEALGCGTPLVLSDLPVLREVAGECAEYLPPTDAGRWRMAVLRALEQGNEGKELHARRRAEANSLDQSAELLMEQFFRA